MDIDSLDNLTLHQLYNAIHPNSPKKCNNGKRQKLDYPDKSTDKVAGGKFCYTFFFYLLNQFKLTFLLCLDSSDSSSSEDDDDDDSGSSDSDSDSD